MRRVENVGDAMGLKRQMGWRKFGDCPAGGPAGAWPSEALSINATAIIARSIPRAETFRAATG